MIPLRNAYFIPPAFRLVPVDPGAREAPAHRRSIEPAPAPGGVPGQAEAGLLDTDTVLRLATGLWRIRERMIDPKTREPLPEMRKALRHVDRTLEDLRDAGIEVRDHTGESMPDIGVTALRVIAFESRPGLATQCVVETVKPSVFAQGRLVQMGEVIVGKPDPSELA